MSILWRDAVSEKQVKTAAKISDTTPSTPVKIQVRAGDTKRASRLWGPTSGANGEPMIASPNTWKKPCAAPALGISLYME